MTELIHKVIQGASNSAGTRHMYQLDQRSHTRDRKKSDRRFSLNHAGTFSDANTHTFTHPNEV